MVVKFSNEVISRLFILTIVVCKIETANKMAVKKWICPFQSKRNDRKSSPFDDHMRRKTQGSFGEAALLETQPDKAEELH